MRKIMTALFLAALGFAVAQVSTSFPQTASYGIFPINASGVGGSIQLTEEMGQTRVAVTLTGIMRGEQYLPVLFEGTCGPDREMVAALAPVGNFTNDPFVSLDHIDVGINTLTSGQYFVYIFRGSEMPPENDAGFVSIDTAVACGQVGLGANR